MVSQVYPRAFSTQLPPRQSPLAHGGVWNCSSPATGFGHFHCWWGSCRPISAASGWQHHPLVYQSLLRVYVICCLLREHSVTQITSENVNRTGPQTPGVPHLLLVSIQLRANDGHPLSLAVQLVPSSSSGLTSMILSPGQLCCQIPSADEWDGFHWTPTNHQEEKRQHRGFQKTAKKHKGKPASTESHFIITGREICLQVVSLQNTCTKKEHHSIFSYLRSLELSFFKYKLLWLGVGATPKVSP